MNAVAISSYNDQIHRQSVIGLWTSVFGYDAPHNDPALAIDKKLQAHDDLFFVAHVVGAVMGTIMAGYDGHRGWMYSLAVSPALRHQGIGSQLVSHAEDALIRKGCVKINLQILEANQDVIAFYTALGYSLEKRISMGKKLHANIPSAEGEPK